MNRLGLPLGIQDFKTIREDNFYYVDKTPLIRELVGQGRRYFLSRPRRFGKSLLISTLKSLFEGDQELFRGLDIHDDWDWSVRYPVVRLSLGGEFNKSGGLERSILNQLIWIEEQGRLDRPSLQFDTGPERLLDILRRLHATTGHQVVVLVDEYDKPVLDVLHNQKMAEENQEYLKGFYGILKDADEHVRFLFVAGISMFTKENMFSGLNNLVDISLDSRYSSICGYTDRDLDTVFSTELEGFDRGQIGKWYNGYNWLGKDRLYNPCDVLHLFHKRKFRAWWFNSGTPAFLYQMLADKGINIRYLVGRSVKEDVISTFEINHISIDALMFQSGYLTIIDEDESDSLPLYRLDFPNYEVQLSFHRGLLKHVTRDDIAEQNARALIDFLDQLDFKGFATRLHANLAGIPYQWHDNANLARYESWYASMLYMSFVTCEADIRIEESSSHGRSDLVLCHGRQVFVMELKVVDDESQSDSALAQALAQIRDKGYSKSYAGKNHPIHHIALCFGRESRNLLGMQVEQA